MNVLLADTGELMLFSPDGTDTTSLGVFAWKIKLGAISDTGMSWKAFPRRNSLRLTRSLEDPESSQDHTTRLHLSTERNTDETTIAATVPHDLHGTLARKPLTMQRRPLPVSCMKFIF